MKTIRSNIVLSAIALVLGITTIPVTSAEEGLEEVIVTGSYIRHANQADVPSPIDIVTMEDIQQNGWATLEDMTETLTFNPNSFGRNGTGLGCCGFARGIDLRGLGGGSTLVLQNGKRVASAAVGDNAADMANIKAMLPIIAVERMETLLDGAAAIYGSDAIAGVANFIPRKDFEGFEMRVGGKAIDGSDKSEIQLLFGTQGERVSGIFAISHERTSLLRKEERDFFTLNITSSFGTPGAYILDVNADDADGDGVPDLRPGGADDIIINNGFHPEFNVSQIWDDALAGTGPFADRGPQTNIRLADPYCRPGIVPDYPGRSRDGTQFELVPGGGQFDDLYAGAPFPIGNCRYTFQPTNFINPAEDITLAYTNWTFDFAPGNQLEFEYSLRWMEGYRLATPAFPHTNATIFVPASNPANPFGQDVNWRGRAIGNAYAGTPVDNRVDYNAQSHRVAATWHMDLAEMFPQSDFLSSWTVDISAQSSYDYQTDSDRDTDLSRTFLALRGFGGPNCQNVIETATGTIQPSPTETAGVGNCYYFSPFGQDIYKSTFDPTSGFGQVFSVNQATGERIQAPDETVFQVIDWFLGESESYDERDLNVFEAIASGSLMELPAGDLGIAVGYQRRWDRFKRFDTYFEQSFLRAFQTPGIGGTGSRSVDAIFAELYVPVADSLDVQLAVRRESYDQGLGSTTDPKVGVNFRPTDWMTVRGSYSTSYRTPSLKQVVGTDAQSRLRSVADPLDPSEFGVGNLNFRTARVAKNPDLLPEESTNYNFGISFLPTVPWGDNSHSLQIDVDYFDFDFKNRIELKGAQDALNLDPCGPNIIRDPVVFISDPLLENDPTGNCGSGPVGEILIIDQAYSNSGGTTTSGLDISALYRFDINDIQMSIRSETSHFLTYEVELASGAIIDGAGGTNDNNPAGPIPEWRTNLMVNGTLGNHSAGATFRYSSEMEEDRTSNVVDSHLEVDVQYAYSFGDQQQYSVTVGAINVFDEEPPFYTRDGSLQRVHNPYMRQIYARFGLSL